MNGLSLHYLITKHRLVINPDIYFSWQDLKYNSEEFNDAYKHNSTKDELVLSYAENFRRQYVHLYRDRKPLLLNPLNECGIEVCLIYHNTLTQLKANLKS